MAKCCESKEAVYETNLIFLTTLTSGTDLLAVSAWISWWHNVNAAFFPGYYIKHSNSGLMFHLPALVMIISVPSSLNRSHNSFPSNSTVMFLNSSLNGFSNTSPLSSSSVATSLDKDFILLAGGGWALSSSEALSLSLGDSLGSKYENANHHL